MDWSDSLFLWSQIFTILAHIAFVWCLFVKSRTQLLAINSVGNVFMIVGFWLISAWAGMIALVVALGRDATNYTIYRLKRKENKYKITRWDTASIIIWVSVLVAVSMPTVDGWISSFAIAATIIFSIAIWQKSIVVFRLSSIVVNVMWGVYMWDINNVSGLYLRGVLLAATLIGLVVYLRQLRYTNKHEAI